MAHVFNSLINREAHRVHLGTRWASTRSSKTSPHDALVRGEYRTGVNLIFPLLTFVQGGNHSLDAQSGRCYRPAMYNSPMRYELGPSRSPPPLGLK